MPVAPVEKETALSVCDSRATRYNIFQCFPLSVVLPIVASAPTITSVEESRAATAVVYNSPGDELIRFHPPSGCADDIDKNATVQQATANPLTRPRATKEPDFIFQ